jgi:sugar lactone lactonase YvrE
MLKLLLLLAGMQTPAESTWRDHDRAARDARNAGDWRTARLQTQKMDSLLGGHPAVVLGLARTDLQLADTVAALDDVERYVAMGLVIAPADSALRSLVAKRPSLASRLASNAAPVGRPATVAVMPQADFVAEGVAWDGARRSALVSSIRHGTIVRANVSGAVVPFADLGRDGGWGALGMAVDSARNRVWVTTMWYAFGAGFSAADSGRSAVHAYDLATGKLLRRIELPRGNTHEPGDICVAPNGDLFVSDGREGMIRVIRNGADSIATFVAAGPLVSPQGCAVEPDGRRMFVADYALGIMSVDLRTARVTRLARPRAVAVNGIDGLAMSGDHLVGVQNGVTPNRIIAIQLDSKHQAITAVCTIARDAAKIHVATHTTIQGGNVLFVENGGFDAYDDKGALKPGVTPVAPRIGRVALAASGSHACE